MLNNIVSLRLLPNHPHTLASPCQFVVNPSEQMDVLPVPVSDCPPPAIVGLPCFIFDLLVFLRENMKTKISKSFELGNCTSHLPSC